jgi:hypothetical protein
MILLGINEELSESTRKRPDLLSIEESEGIGAEQQDSDRDQYYDPLSPDLPLCTWGTSLLHLEPPEDSSQIRRGSHQLADSPAQSVLTSPYRLQ